MQEPVSSNAFCFIEIRSFQQNCTFSTKHDLIFTWRKFKKICMVYLGINVLAKHFTHIPFSANKRRPNHITISWYRQSPQSTALDSTDSSGWPLLWLEKWITVPSHSVYHTCTIITCSWLETAVEYYPYIRTEFSEKKIL